MYFKHYYAGQAKVFSIDTERNSKRIEFIVCILYNLIKRPVDP